MRAACSSALVLLVSATAAAGAAPPPPAITPTPAVRTATSRADDGSPAPGTETLEFGRFGKVWVYRPAREIRHVALFISGDGGWKLGVIDMAHDVQALDTLVLGVDILHYLRVTQAAAEGCTYAAADFEALSQFAQKKLGLPSYHVPVLLGYSSGATMAYAILVQAPPNTFLGAISLGFCPDLEIAKPLCKGNGLTWEGLPKGKHGFYFLPSGTLEAPFVAMQGLIDQVCDPPSTKAYVAKVANGEVVELPKVGHGYAVPRNWLPQFKDAYLRVASREAPGAPAALATSGGAPEAATGPATGAGADVADLPLVEVPASGPGTDTVAVMISGDGGWANIDRQIAGVLAARGVPVVGLNSLQYLWKPKSPELAGRDLERIARHALAGTGAARLLLAGYSLGADILPFGAARLPEELRQRVSLVALLGPSPAVTFEFHLSNWLGGGSDEDALPIRPEIEKLKGLKVLCAWGSEEKDSVCPALGDQVERLELSGAHHFGGDYKAIADTILRSAGVAPSATAASPGTR